MYHDRALELLGRELPVSAKAVATLDRLELDHGFRYPAAVREWYEREGAVETLGSEVGSRPLPLSGLYPGNDEHWECSAPRARGAEPVIWIVAENQAVWRWGVRVDGSDDPEVITQTNSADQDSWHPCCAQFSDFVLASVFDYSDGWPWDRVLTDAGFDEGDETILRQVGLTYPGTSITIEDCTEVSHRFRLPQGLVHVGVGATAIWWLRSRTPAELEELVAVLRRCPNFRDT